jgi:aminoglycoside phosphotransferase (APT) family kinase protein
LLNYTDEQIKKELEGILERYDFDIKPVGNHSLKRHLVYQIDMKDGEKFIFKLYYRDRRRSREIASLKLLESSEVKCPKIFKYGNLDNGSQWLITQYVEGDLLDKVMGEMSQDNRLTIFEEIGEELGELHSFRTFDFFGEWDEEGKSIKNIKNYYDHFVLGMERTINEVLEQDLPDKHLLINAIKIIRDNYEKLNIKIEARLLHNDFDGRNILVKENGGVYKLSGIIDFECSYPGNAEENLVQLYYRYFLDNKYYENAFFKGYKKYISESSKFIERLNIYMLCFVVGNCSWSYIQATDYYKDNIEFLKKFLNKDFIKNCGEM